MAASLSEQLGEVFDGAEWPAVSAVTIEDGTAMLAIQVNPEISWFEGHFPNNPVLPGVVQVHWAVEYARHLFKLEQAFEKVENLKFKSVVFPEMQIELRLSHEPEKDMVRFSYRNADTVYSEGRITFS